MRIIEQPQDQVVQVGDMAIFACLYSESYNIPYWIINDVIYSRNNLPRRYLYRNQRLILHNVLASDNGTIIQCTFVLVTSQEAILMVNSTDDEGMMCENSLKDIA